jgi:hypothetical protein
VILNEWDMKRVQMPERAYKKFFFCTIIISFIVHLVKQKPFNYGASHTRECGAGTEDMLGEQFREVL